MSVGFIWTVLLNGMLGLAGYGVARYGFRQTPGLPRALAASVLAWSWATLGVLVLGSVGLLARTPLLCWSAAGLAIAGVLRTLRPDERTPTTARAVGWDGAATASLALVIW